MSEICLNKIVIDERGGKIVMDLNSTVAIIQFDTRFESFFELSINI